jgi:hypothetical protein
VAQQALADRLDCRLKTAPFTRASLGIDAKKDQSRHRSTPANHKLSEILVLGQQYLPLFLSPRDCFGVGYP